MGIEDTFGYRFVRTSLVMLNCVVLLRLISLLLQFNQMFEPAFLFFIILISSNFCIAVIGAIREHRAAVMLTGSVTLIMFLSLIFTTKENKGVNVILLILLAVSVQSLIFSEMLKEKQIYVQRRRRLLDTLANTSSLIGTSEDGRRLAAVVVYPSQHSGDVRAAGGAVFTLDPELSVELAKDPPPPYFAASNCPPPKYEDAIQLNATSLNTPSSSTSSTSQQVAITAENSQQRTPQPMPSSTSLTNSPSTSSASSSASIPNTEQPSSPTKSMKESLQKSHSLVSNDVNVTENVDCVGSNVNDNITNTGDSTSSSSKTTTTTTVSPPETNADS